MEAYDMEADDAEADATDRRCLAYSVARSSSTRGCRRANQCALALCAPPALALCAPEALALDQGSVPTANRPQQKAMSLAFGPDVARGAGCCIRQSLLCGCELRTDKNCSISKLSDHSATDQHPVLKPQQKVVLTTA